MRVFGTLLSQRHFSRFAECVISLMAAICLKEGGYGVSMTGCDAPPRSLGQASSSAGNTALSGIDRILAGLQLEIVVRPRSNTRKGE